jgi:hypothetical protein
MGTLELPQEKAFAAMSSAGFEGDATSILFCIKAVRAVLPRFSPRGPGEFISELLLPSAILAHMPAASTFCREGGKQLHPSPAFNSTLFLHPINNSVGNLAMENSQSTNGSRVKRKASATKTKTLPCPHCQRLFARLEHLQRHIR